MRLLLAIVAMGIAGLAFGQAEELAHPYASSDIALECLLLAARYRASAQASR